ncbi:hypothetical protein ACI797_22160 [Geodermatophilus sp. SYSU D00691]
MRRVAVTVASTAAFLLAMGGTAFADAHNAPLYRLVCANGHTYTVASPDHAATGQDLDSTAVLTVAGRGVPTAKTMSCEVTSLADPDDVFTANFLIPPA